MQWTRDDVTYEQEAERLLPGSTALEHCDVPAGEEAQADDFRPPPPSATLGLRWLECRLGQKHVGVGIEVETR